MAEARQRAIVLYHGFTVLDALGPYEILQLLPEVEIRFVASQPAPIATDGKVLAIGATHTFDETPAPFLALVPGSEANATTAMADPRLVAWLKAAHALFRDDGRADDPLPAFDEPGVRERQASENAYPPAPFQTSRKRGISSGIHT